MLKDVLSCSSHERTVKGMRSVASNGPHLALHIGNDWILKTKSMSCSPVQRDLGILLCLHGFLIFGSYDWGHNVMYKQLIVYL